MIDVTEFKLRLGESDVWIADDFILEEFINSFMFMIDIIFGNAVDLFGRNFTDTLINRLMHVLFDQY